jgi:hypothetical protein
MRINSFRHAITCIAVMSLVGCSATSTGNGGAANQSGATKTFCEIAKTAGQDKELTNVLASQSPDPKKLGKVTTFYSSLVAVAPAEIKPELTATRDFIRDDLASILAINSVSNDPAKAEKLLKELQPVLTRMETINSGMAKVSTYTQQTCGVTL